SRAGFGVSPKQALLRELGEGKSSRRRRRHRQHARRVRYPDNYEIADLGLLVRPNPPAAAVSAPISDQSALGGSATRNSP
ncbi:MAG: hypothetical protein M3Y03_07215, partial [Verrucomicrobiota bacterium]|nr:hypothetical protein [Verrucomicrobiota bacterium]